jgi:hypothetical protein
MGPLCSWGPGATAQCAHALRRHWIRRKFFNVEMSSPIENQIESFQAIKKEF